MLATEVDDQVLGHSTLRQCWFHPSEDFLFLYINVDFLGGNPICRQIFRYFNELALHLKVVYLKISTTCAFEMIASGSNGLIPNKLTKMLTANRFITFVTTNRHLLTFAHHLAITIEAHHHVSFAATMTDGFQLD